MIGLYCVIGWIRGFLHIAVDYASLAIGLLLAAVLHRPLGRSRGSKGLERRTDPGGGIHRVVDCRADIAGILLGMDCRADHRRHTAGMAVRGLPKPIRKNPMNRVLGVGASALKGLVLAALGVLLMNSRTAGAGIPPSRTQSSVAGW